MTNKAGEELQITIRVEHDSSHELGLDPGSVKDGVEAHLQELLAEHVETLGSGDSLVSREYMTAIGPVDLLCRDADGGRSQSRSNAVAKSTGSTADALPRTDEP